MESGNMENRPRLRLASVAPEVEAPQFARLSRYKRTHGRMGLIMLHAGGSAHWRERDSRERAAKRARVMRSRRPPSLRKSCSNRRSC